MSDEPSVPQPPKTSRPGIPKDEARLEMMRREKHMTVDERLDLFEQLSRFVAWARSANRLR